MRGRGPERRWEGVGGLQGPSEPRAESVEYGRGENGEKAGWSSKTCCVGKARSSCGESCGHHWPSGRPVFPRTGHTVFLLCSATAWQQPVGGVAFPQVQLWVLGHSGWALGQCTHSAVQLQEARFHGYHVCFIFKNIPAILSEIKGYVME